MPFKHAGHNVFGFILGVFATVLLAEIFKRYVPNILAFFDKISKFLIKFLKIDISAKTLTAIVVILLVTASWGFIIGFLEKRKSK